MKTPIKRPSHNIDATNQVIGRLASRVATLLMGKDQANYFPYQDGGAKVIVSNVAAMNLNPKKLAKRVIYHHTQHPGGLQVTKASDYSPAQLLRRAIYTMLPDNKLRDKMLKRLTIR